MSIYYSTAELAKKLSVTPRTVRNFIKRGLFPGAYKLDPTSKRSPYRIPKTDLNAFLKIQQGNK